MAHQQEQATAAAAATASASAAATSATVDAEAIVDDGAAAGGGLFGGLKGGGGAKQSRARIGPTSPTAASSPSARPLRSASPDPPAQAPSRAGASERNDKVRQVGPTYWEPLLGKARHPLRYTVDENGKGREAGLKPCPFFKPDVAPNEKSKYDSISEAAEAVLRSNDGGGDPDDPDLESHKFWVQLTRKHQPDGRSAPAGQVHKKPAGQLLVSLQLVPAHQLDSLPAGEGRKEPNSNPKLPKPVGRVYFTLNPFAMCAMVLGPRLCGKLMCALCCVFLVLLLYYMLPVLLGNTITGLVSSILGAG